MSVVMGTYNGARYVGEQLESILAQTLLPAEILVSDDGSTDATLEVVAAVAATSDVPIHVHRNERNLGFAENFLSACERATSRYIAFSDQDDRWRPEKLEHGVRALETTGALLSSHLVGQIDADGRRLAGSPATLTEPWVIESEAADPWGNFYGFTMVFERSLLSRLPADDRGRDPHSQDAELSHDRWIWFLASTFGRMVQLDERLADYRQHDNQLYGGLKPRSALERVATKLRDGHDHSVNLADVAGHRAALLERDAGLDDAELRQAAAARWRTWERRLRESAVLYSEIGAHRRGSLFLRSLARGSYAPVERGGLGRRRLRHDLAMVAVPRIPALVALRDGAGAT